MASSRPQVDAPAAEWQEKLLDRLQVFARKWKDFEGSEQSSAQPFLWELLEIYGVEHTPGGIFEQHPVRVPAKGKKAQQTLFGDAETEVAYTTERMDMYLPRICVWEMKAPREKDLQVHHEQILGYWARMRPRYMVLCNFREFWIYDTADEDGQLTPKLKFTLEELPGRGDALLFLRGEQPDLEQRAERVTAEVAGMLGRLVRGRVEAGARHEQDRDRVARVVLECVFAMFAEDTELIPGGMFSGALKSARDAGSMAPVWELFEDFARRGAARKHHRFAPYVNGPLFDLDRSQLELTEAEIGTLFEAAHHYDWQDVRPEIFGSIFEQALDASERHELGAHFTREADIARVVMPTVIEPWRERIEALRYPKDAEELIERMRAFHVLDPACGCGNFLYVVYREMKRLEAYVRERWYWLQRKVAKRKADMKPAPPGPYFSLSQLHGIEKDAFGAFLARVVLWIGEHLAARELGLDEQVLPLKNLDKVVRCGDALDLDWPRPEGELAIVGNPPYLGVRKMRHELGDEYVERMFARYPDNRAADYVTYWFSRAIDTLRTGERAGFVATKSIAENEGREASLDRIVAKGGTLTEAWTNYPWPGEAAVHICIVDWLMGSWEGIRKLDGKEVDAIPTSLSSAGDVTTARHIAANEDLCFMGFTPGNNEFVLTDEQRAEIVEADPKSSEVIKPFLVGRDVNREVAQKSTRSIIDFGLMEKDEAEQFAGAMRHVKKFVYPIRKDNRRAAYAERWWRFVEARPGLRRQLAKVTQVLVIPAVSPDLVVSRQPASICFDHQLMVVTLETPYHLGVLLSAIHEIWANHRCSRHEDRLRYTNTTIFETFPFPLQADGSYDPRRVPKTAEAKRVADAAEELERVRAAACKERGLGLTKIHNLLEAGQLPELSAAYAELNDAVTACYGFPDGTWRDEAKTLARLLELNRKVAERG